MTVKHDRIVRGDCITELERLEADCVDLAFADPPFNIGYDYDEYDDRRADEDYLAWSKRWMQGVIRVLRPWGAFWLAIGDEYAAELKLIATRELGLVCRSWVVWYYTFGVHCKKKFTRSHVHLFHFVRDPTRFTFNSLEIRVPSARQLVYGDKRAEEGGRIPDDTWMMPLVLAPDAAVYDGFILRPQDIPHRFPPHSDTWFFSRVAGTFNERRGWHGCQMPEQLLGRIIKACSNEGELVLDPFAGSGTTLAVAKKLSRRFVGFEVSREYAQRIEARLSGIHPGDPLTGPEDATMSAPATNRGRRSKPATVLPAKTISKSPVVVRTNVSLGQIAAANGELYTAIAEAFLAAHEGYSADRVLADPSLNDNFLENCRLLGIPGGPKEWNHRLLALRKRGGLSKIDTARRTKVTRDSMEPFIYASEMAWRKLSDKHAGSLDEILCDPKIAEEFDRIAGSIAPRYSSFDYRWAALSLRKFASKGSAILNRINDAWSPRIVRLTDTPHLRRNPGHFLISIAEEPFFTGFAKSLGECALFDRDRLGAALNEMGHNRWSERDIEIRTRLSDFDHVCKQIPGIDGIQWEAARRARVLNRFRPMANVLPSSSAA